LLNSLTEERDRQNVILPFSITTLPRSAEISS
jgi:hypothetical protein